MKNSKVAVFVKHVVSVLSALAKSKSDAIRSKTGAIKARIVLFSLMKSKKLSLQGRLGMGAISDKIHALLGQHDQHTPPHEDDQENNNSSSTVVVVSNNINSSESSHVVNCHESSGTLMNGQDRFLLEYHDNDDDDKYPDLRHSLFEEEEDEMLGDPNASAIEMVRSSKEDEGEMFVLEDEIDHVADLFIKKFHKRMRLQKLESFKRLQEMLQRGT